MNSNELKPGDRVGLMDDDLEGKVISLKGEQVAIETTEGFVMDFPASDLVKMDEDIADMQIESDIDLAEILKEKAPGKKKNLEKIKSKERNAPPMEVDLHIHQLTSKRNLSNHEMLNLQLDAARRQLEFAISKRIQKVVFIHGVGEGVLKMELEYLFGRYENVKFYDADYKKYGLGATEVYVFQNT